MYRQINVSIEGIAPLLMHNGQTADPMNRYSRQMGEITVKRKKNDSDYSELRRIEWLSSLYVNDAGQPAVPGENIESMLIAAGKKLRLGEACKAGIISDGVWPVQHQGSSSTEDLYDDPRFVDSRRVRNPSTRAAVVRTRAKFFPWVIEFALDYDDEILSVSQVEQIVQIAGRNIGLCDYRPKFGRFEIVKFG